ncbi:hypothetical protein HO173_010398 [Letharia columbiana]|uniref:Uncharacterized protein n=1 Tax=Letharia columbiana TaxID=112416 RepID=A0A8H6L0Y4_9LECA|nr:uncharacterized protein HO173_010398 [Letharia columbiana]KAF6231437.1 hypothetical protein HO173_010398 [Letharia columbiana]
MSRCFAKILFPTAPKNSNTINVCATLSKVPTTLIKLRTLLLPPESQLLQRMITSSRQHPASVLSPSAAPVPLGNRIRKGKGKGKATQWDSDDDDDDDAYVTSNDFAGTPERKRSGVNGFGDVGGNDDEEIYG